MKVERRYRSGATAVLTYPKATPVGKYFALEELANNSGDPSQAQWIDSDMSNMLVQVLDDYRTWLRKPVKINDSYRQPAWNKKVGGTATSLHLKAQAADVAFKPMTELQWKHIRDFMTAEFRKYSTVGELIRYDWGFHVAVGVTYQKNDWIEDKTK